MAGTDETNNLRSTQRPSGLAQARGCGSILLGACPGHTGPNFVLLPTAPTVWALHTADSSLMVHPGSEHETSRGPHDLSQPQGRNRPEHPQIKTSFASRPRVRWGRVANTCLRFNRCATNTLRLEHFVALSLLDMPRKSQRHKDRLDSSGFVLGIQRIWEWQPRIGPSGPQTKGESCSMSSGSTGHVWQKARRR